MGPPGEDFDRRRRVGNGDEQIKQMHGRLQQRDLGDNASVVLPTTGHEITITLDIVVARRISAHSVKRVTASPGRRRSRGGPLGDAVCGGVSDSARRVEAARHLRGVGDRSGSVGRRGVEHVEQPSVGASMRHQPRTSQGVHRVAVDHCCGVSSAHRRAHRSRASADVCRTASSSRRMPPPWPAAMGLCHREIGYSTVDQGGHHE